MKTEKRNIWDTLASNDPRLTTDGFHLLNSNYSAEDVGSILVAREYIKPEKGKRLLDIGCGWGKIVVPYSKLGLETYGIDISKVMLGEANKYASSESAKVRLVNSDAELIPFQDGRFDIIWSYAVLIHLPKDKVQKILGEISRVMAADGHAYLHFKNSWHAITIAMVILKWLVRLRKKNPIEVEIRRYSISEINRMALKHFGKVEVWSENMEVLPLSIPKNFFSSGEDVLGGIITTRDTGFINLLPRQFVMKAITFYNWLKKLANSRFPALRWLSKDFIVVLSEPKE